MTGLAATVAGVRVSTTTAPGPADAPRTGTFYVVLAVLIGVLLLSTWRLRRRP